MMCHERRKYSLVRYGWFYTTCLYSQVSTYCRVPAGRGLYCGMPARRGLYYGMPARRGLYCGVPAGWGLYCHVPREWGLHFIASILSVNHEVPRAKEIFSGAVWMVLYNLFVQSG